MLSLPSLKCSVSEVRSLHPAPYYYLYYTLLSLHLDPTLRWFTKPASRICKKVHVAFLGPHFLGAQAKFIQRYQNHCSREHLSMYSNTHRTLLGQCTQSEHSILCTGQWEQVREEYYTRQPVHWRKLQIPNYATQIISSLKINTFTFINSFCLILWNPKQ